MWNVLNPFCVGEGAVFGMLTVPYAAGDALQMHHPCDCNTENRTGEYL